MAAESRGGAHEEGSNGSDGTGVVLAGAAESPQSTE